MSLNEEINIASLNSEVRHIDVYHFWPFTFTPDSTFIDKRECTNRTQFCIQSLNCHKFNCLELLDAGIEEGFPPVGGRR